MSWLKRTIEETTVSDGDNTDFYAGGVVVVATVATVISIWGFGL